MKTYEFRGLRSYDKKWIYGSLLIDNRGNFHIVENDVVEEDGHHIRIDSDSPMLFDNETIGQFTGLYDCKRTKEFPNGQKIFEGDVVKIRLGNGYETFEEEDEVTWDEYGYSPMKWQYECDGCSIRCEILEIEVIGNIHEKENDNDE